MTNYIDKIGVEVEAGFAVGERFEDNEFYKVHYDGSIGAMYDCQCLELVTRPCVSKAKLFTALTKIYKNLVRVNHTCGFHVHISLKKDTDYQKLASLDFYNHFLDKAKRNRLFFGLTQRRRLDGINRYCKSIDDWRTIQEQIDASERYDCRYKILNYCKNIHNTVEFRVLRAFEKLEDAKKVVNFVVDVVNNYLDNKKPLEFKELIKGELIKVVEV